MVHGPSGSPFAWRKVRYFRGAKGDMSREKARRIEPCQETQMLRQLRHLLEMIRFSHTLFALPFALLAAAMAWGLNARSTPPVAVPLARPRRHPRLHGHRPQRGDGLQPPGRPADRRLEPADQDAAPAQRRAERGRGAGLHDTLLAGVRGWERLLFLPNRIPLAASLPVLLFLFGYSYAKRFTLLSHVWLGIALALAPSAAWVVLRAEIAWPPLVLSTAVALWVAGFDMIYACQDYAFDVSMRLHSIPARLGVAGALRLAAACHLLMLVLLAILPWTYPLFGVRSI